MNKFKENQSLKNYVSMFEEIYEPIQNVERDFHLVLARIIEAIATCSQHINKSNETGVAENLPKIFSWYCSLVYKSGIKNIDDAVWRKFPNCCPYCLSSRCSCTLGRKSFEDNSLKLAEKAKNIDQRPTSLDDWQKTFASIYPRDPQGFDQKSNFIHLIEELGETSEAYRLHYFFHSALESELADVFTWIIGMANLLDSRAKDNCLHNYAEYRLAKEVFSRYPGTCIKCHQIPCTCVIEELEQKISEPFDSAAIAEKIIKAIDKSKEDLQLTFNNRLDELFKEQEAQLFLQALKHITKTSTLTESKIRQSIEQITVNSSHRKWYQSINSAGLAETDTVSLLTSLVQNM